MTDVKTAGTGKLPRAAREPLLLDAASREFGEHGYGGASLGSIATRAGVSKALVVTYFGSKDGLYAACVTRAGEDITRRVEKVITSPLGVTEMAEATLAAIFEALQERPQDWNVINDRTVPPGSEAAAAARTQRHAIAEQAVRGIANLSQFTALDTDNAELLTSVWMGAVSAVVNWWLRHPDRTPVEMTARCATVLGVLLHH